MMRRRDWIAEKLENWAKWLVERQGGAAGYPKQSAFVGLRTTQSSTDRVPVDSIDASRTDDAVSTLRYSASHLWLVLMCRYLGDPRARRGRRRPMLFREIGDAMNTSEDSAKKQFGEAKKMVAVTLNRKHP
jgi:hypothetical protein